MTLFEKVSEKLKTLWDTGTADQATINGLTESFNSLSLQCSLIEAIDLSTQSIDEVIESITNLAVINSNRIQENYSRLFATHAYAIGQVDLLYTELASEAKAAMAAYNAPDSSRGDLLKTAKAHTLKTKNILKDSWQSIRTINLKFSRFKYNTALTNDQEAHKHLSTILQSLNNLRAFGIDIPPTPSIPPAVPVSTEKKFDRLINIAQKTLMSCSLSSKAPRLAVVITALLNKTEVLSTLSKPEKNHWMARLYAGMATYNMCPPDLSKQFRELGQTDDHAPHGGIRFFGELSHDDLDAISTAHHADSAAGSAQSATASMARAVSFPARADVISESPMV